MKRIITNFALLPLVFAACTSVPSSNHAEEKDSKIVVDSKVEENSLDKEFIKSLENVNLKLTTSPKQTVTGTAFNSVFSVFVSDKDGAPLASYPVTITYPSEKVDGKVVFASTNILSDEKGMCTFTAEKPVFACNEKLTFAPAAASESSEVLEAVAKKAVSADWKVKSDITRKGAVLFVWEFNEKNRPTRNSYEVLSKLKGYGIWNVGNAPINETTDIGKSLQILYKENYEIIEDQYGYLICGTIKFSQPVTALESGNGYCCTLVAEILL